jgi:MOB kinase activator 1
VHRGNKNKTFKPKRKLAKGTKRYSLHKQAKASLGSGDLRQAVVLPENEDLNEWLAAYSTYPIQIASQKKKK